jgi:hypothetical protein
MFVVLPMTFYLVRQNLAMPFPSILPILLLPFYPL